jgi:aminopeptidase
LSEQQIAQRVLNQCLRLKEDEQLLISAWHHTLPLASAIALEASKLGATPLITVETDWLMLNYLTQVPEEYFTKKQKAYLSMLDGVDATVSLGGPEDPGIFQKISGERLAKGFESNREIVDREKERKIRNIFLPHGQLTPQRARTYGFDLKHWTQVTNEAIDVDHAKMAVLGKKLASKLEKTSKVHLTAANGTDLTFSLGDRPVHVHDGIVDDEDVAKGTTFEFLPSGQVEVAPVESSVDGTILFDQPMALRGKMVRGLKLKFENGKLVKYEAEANLDAFGDYYQGASGDKDRIASFSIGLNPSSGYIGYFTDGLVLGAVTVGVGGNKEIGGTNQTSFGHAQTLTKATVEADGTQILTNGKPNV